jgi:hypothetical protein
MTATRNTDLARRAATFALAFSAIPNLDDLPDLAHVEVNSRYYDGDTDAEVEAQIGAHHGRDDVAEQVRGVIAWRDALTGGEVRVGTYSHQSRPTHLHVAARGHLGGVDVEVWTSVQVGTAIAEQISNTPEAHRADDLLAALASVPA